MMCGRLLGGAATMLVMAGAAGAAHAAAPDQAYQVRIEHAAARVVVIPEARNNVSVTVSHGGSRLPQLTVRQEGGRVFVEGHLEDGLIPWHDGGHIRCISHHSHFPFGHNDFRGVRVAGVGDVAYADLPVITVHAPMQVSIAAGSAVFGEVGRSESVDLANSGCGDWSVADTRGRLALATSGSGDVRAGSAGSLHSHMSGSGDLRMGALGGDSEVAVSGSGDVELGALRGGLLANIAGSGNLTAAEVQGPVEVHISGSGDTRIHGGHAPNVKASVAGSGDFRFDGVAGALTAAVAGSGDVYVAHVTGPVSKKVAGSGSVRTGS